MNIGIDSPVDCGKYLDKIIAEKLAFVGRYYRSASSSWPKLTASEAKLLSQAGLQIVALWESASDHPSYFSHASGVSDGARAYAEALQVGQPADTPIYFAVDFDASESDVSGCINEYFEGIAAGYEAISQSAAAYTIGVYGSGATCSWLLHNERVKKTWLAVSSGWLGSRDFDGWNIKQGAGLQLGFDNDSDSARDGYGGFQIS